VLSLKTRASLRAQEAVAQACLPLTYYSLLAWMRWRRYRVEGLDRCRAEFAGLARGRRGPLLVCANHLTLVDSLVVQWALTPGWSLGVRPGWFLWNLPDRHNISASWFRRALGYVGKCLPVLRQGPPEEARRTLEKVAWLLGRGQSVLVFPEGGRSRIGRVDTDRVMYGVGRMLRESPGARVLCVYARGVGQLEFSDYPRPGERFFVRMSAIAPTTSFHGMRADRDLAMQIAGRLVEMEQEYFAHARLDR
jgi:hypothetical protein